jgi:thiosulfate/3-mercaptopyruvate sulfurtransferase
LNIISVESLARNPGAWLIIDCRFSLADTNLGEQQYLEGHIPGARYAHLDEHLSGEITVETGRHPLPDFDKLVTQLGQWGVNEHSRVVAYDDASGSYASRLWWLLRTLGHTEVAVLDGGIQAWQAAGEKLEAGIPVHSPTQFKATLNREAWSDTRQLQQQLATGDCVLIDARAKQRFDGVTEPIDPVAGHIPGSVNMPVTENFDKNGFFLPAETLRENYLSVMSGATPEQVVHSCGSGVFACLGILAMEVAGLEGSRLYPGSWSEWIRDPERGVATR